MVRLPQNPDALSAIPLIFSFRKSFREVRAYFTARPFFVRSKRSGRNPRFRYKQVRPHRTRDFLCVAFSSAPCSVDASLCAKNGRFPILAILGQNAEFGQFGQNSRISPKFPKSRFPGIWGNFPEFPEIWGGRVSPEFRRNLDEIWTISTI